MELVLTGVVLAAMVAMIIVARAFRREDDPGVMVMIAGLLLAAIWVSPIWRSIAVGCLVVAITWAISKVAAVFITAMLIAAGLWVPGGVSVVLLAAVALWGQAEVRAAGVHLRRIARARTLVANQPVTEEMELAGSVRAVTALVDPIHGKPCAYWKVFAGDHTRESDALIEIRGATGSAVIDPATARMDWSGDAEKIPPDRAEAIAEALRLGDARPESAWILAEGTECYVVGWPTWEHGPPSVGLYRDTPVLPMFRSTPEHPAWFANRAEAALRRDRVWALVAWGTWTAVCATIVVTQIGGWA